MNMEHVEKIAKSGIVKGMPKNIGNPKYECMPIVQDSSCAKDTTRWAGRHDRAKKGSPISR